MKLNTGAKKLGWSGIRTGDHARPSQCSNQLSYSGPCMLVVTLLHCLQVTLLQTVSCHILTVAIIRQVTRSQRFQTSFIHIMNAQVYMRDFACIVRVLQNAHMPTKKWRENEWIYIHWYCTHYKLSSFESKLVYIYETLFGTSLGHMTIMQKYRD